MKRYPNAPYSSVYTSLDVPSGKLVVSGLQFDTDCEAWNGCSLGVYEKLAESCGGAVQLKYQLLALAEEGLLWGYTGNSVTDIYTDAESVILGQQGISMKKFPGHRLIDSIFTDSSSYYIADFERYQSVGGKLDQYWAHQRPVVVSVTPGRYYLEHRYGFSLWPGTERTPSIVATLSQQSPAKEQVPFPEEILYEHLLPMVPETYRMYLGFKDSWDFLDVLVVPESNRRGLTHLRFTVPLPSIASSDDLSAILANTGLL